MLSDLRNHIGDEETADICVVGAGPVGIVLALALGRAGLRVCLLESGGALVEDDAQQLNTAEIVGRHHRGIHTGRFRAMGGTSTRWGGQLLPYEPINFEQREWVQHSGWPISDSDLAPYYKRAHGFEGMAGSEADDSRLHEIAGTTADAFPGIEMRFSRWCPQPDFAQLHGAEIAASASIRCVLHATVTSVSVAGGRMDSVIATGLHGRKLRVKAKRFAFCGGAIETARLLLQATEQGAPAPWATENSVLGQYFQDHPTFECADVLPIDDGRLHTMMDMIYRRGHRYQPRIHLGAAFQCRLRTLSVGGLLVFRTSAAEGVSATRSAVRALLQKPSARGALDVARASRSNLPFIARQGWRYAIHRRAYNPSDQGIRLMAFVEQPPRSSSRVTLAKGRDALGMLQARLEWKLGEEELLTVFQFAHVVKAAFEGAGLARVVLEPTLAAKDPEFLHRGWDNYHHMGTARAATTPADGVVDRNLAIFQCPNAYVCGCAVFPTGGFANPTHTAIALAVRLADHLIRQEA